MPNELTYYNTDFSYIKPVRHFKANDPYYFEVDNIPIKQLEENTNFLKDQVDGLLTEGENNQNIEIGRTGFSELKPFVLGNDRVVRVKPGRYTSRINNAFDLTPIQVINQVFGFTNTTTGADGESTNTFEVGTVNNSVVSGVLNEFARGTAGTAFNFNGLAERAFVFAIDSEDGISIGSNEKLNVTSVLDYGEFPTVGNYQDKPTYPNFIGSLYEQTTDVDVRNLTLLKNVFGDSTDAGVQQGRLESQFIKRWRGAIRTSIVDVPEELSIEIPEFDATDFSYTDENGAVQPLDSNQRIDLVFIYSKAIDENSTTIPKFNSLGGPETLTEPTLGILKGAGVGLSRQTSTDDINADDRVNLQTLDGTPIMLANPGDEGGTTTGFSTSSGGVIRGSFPSPDDLMNLAPVLSENLETTAFPLIGQTILPIAYIRVRKGTLTVQSDTLVSDDIVDIRPFFRTTELAYNERAGIAAATPQVSIANPVVSEAHLEKVRAEIYTDLRNRLGNAVPPEPPQDPTSPPPTAAGSRVLATGIIAGGMNYGPEGALTRQRTVDGLTLNELRTSVTTEFGYPTDSVDFAPMWDKAMWRQRNPGQFTGERALDYVNVGSTLMTRHGNPDAFRLPPWNKEAANSIVGNRTDDDYNGNLGSLGMGKLFPTDKFKVGNYQREKVMRNKMNEIYYVSKLIKIANNPFSNYHVNVNLLNCIPLSCMSVQTDQTKQTRSAQPTGIWVVKHPNYFVINVGWACDAFAGRQKQRNGPHVHDTNKFMQQDDQGKPWKDRENARNFTGFMLPQFDAGKAPLADPNSGPSPYRYFETVIQDDKIEGNGGGPNDGGQISDGFTGTFNQATDAESAPKTLPKYYSGITPILYPSVSFEIVGFDDSLYNKTHSGNNLSDKFGNSIIDLS
ncbi:MAG: hypothetical protein CL605_02535 [Altibacter sp.]|uniref:hypothetical protein n=1 Tax=Altibacter sp. TaxID=2024823 RepID=UPI000C8B2425|nr:hypothetical protein [Altibacter sp.]MAP53759.1 hypothetical protein [Altibacter sp.]|tara:strand:+ start:29220 stop:31922 length:2703 start_codon:yes stop_codon:yes gene_type:complete